MREAARGRAAEGRQVIQRRRILDYARKGLNPVSRWWAVLTAMAVVLFFAWMIWAIIRIDY